VVRAGQALAGAQLGQHGGFTSATRAAHPFQFDVLETLFDQRGAHLVVAEDAAIVALGGLVQFDGEVLDGGGLELLGHTLLHVARGLAHLELAVVRRIGNRVGVDARAGLRFGGRISSMDEEAWQLEMQAAPHKTEFSPPAPKHLVHHCFPTQPSSFHLPWSGIPEIRSRPLWYQSESAPSFQKFFYTSCLLLLGVC
jgi:hypothetical protein